MKFALSLLAAMFIGLATLSAGIVGVWALEEVPLTYPVLPVPVLTPTVVQGGTVLVTIDRCNARDVDLHYEVTRKLHNVETGEDVNLPSYGTDVSPGCHHDVGLPVDTSPDTPPGLYVDAGVSHVEGHVKHFAVHWVSAPFRIIKKESP